MRFHKIANVNKALDYIASKGVKLVSIGAEGEKCEGVALSVHTCLHIAKNEACSLNFLLPPSLSPIQSPPGIGFSAKNENHGIVSEKSVKTESATTARKNLHISVTLSKNPLI